MNWMSLVEFAAQDAQEQRECLTIMAASWRADARWAPHQIVRFKAFCRVAGNKLGLSMVQVLNRAIEDGELCASTPGPLRPGTC